MSLLHYDYQNLQINGIDLGISAKWVFSQYLHVINCASVLLLQQFYFINDNKLLFLSPLPRQHTLLCLIGLHYNRHGSKHGHNSRLACLSETNYIVMVFRSSNYKGHLTWGSHIEFQTMHINEMFKSILSQFTCVPTQDSIVFIIQA